MKKPPTLTAVLARAVLSLAIGAILVGSAAQSALAKSMYDGRWSVSIVNGAIERSAEGDCSFAISGKVTGSGTVHVVVARGQQRAEGSGRLSPIDGRGKWISGRGECSGYWTADRRG